MRTPSYLRRACAFVVQEDRRCGRERVFGSVFVEHRRSERARCCSHGTASVLCQGGPRWRTQPIPVAQLGSMRACLPATVGGRSGCEPTAYRVVEYLMRSRRARHDRALAWNTLLRRKEMPCTAVPREPEVTYAPAAARMVDRRKRLYPRRDALNHAATCMPVLWAASLVVARAAGACTFVVRRCRMAHARHRAIDRAVAIDVRVRAGRQRDLCAVTVTSAAHTRSRTEISMNGMH